MVGKNFIKWAGVLLTSVNLAFPSFNMRAQENKEKLENQHNNKKNEENKEERIYKLNLQYEYPAIIVDSDRANDLEASFKESFHDYFSVWKQTRLETFEEDRVRYNDRINRYAIRGFEHGLGNFLKSSEPGAYIDERKRRIEERLKAEFAKIKIRLGSGKEARIDLDVGIKFNIPNTYAYLGTNFKYNGEREIARAELRAMPNWLEARLKMKDFHDLSITLGAKARYTFDEVFTYWRIGKYLDKEKTNKAYDDYFGVEGRIGKFDNGFRDRDRDFDSQLLFIGKVNF